MSLPFTSVVSYHTNPLTCGVAKFSKQLADRLCVPFVGFDNPHGGFPLFSLKWAEVLGFPDWYYTGPQVDEVREIIAGYGRYGVFWHDAGSESITNNATHVFYADPSLGAPGLWCPSLITPKPRPVRLFSFGMASKLQPEKYRRVRELLDAASIRYHLRVSVGIHEGTSLDGAEKHFDALKEIMGPENVTILGILSDDAVSEELSNCDYVLAFFEKGLRANNTTIHAALDHGCDIITNSDGFSPFLLCQWTHRIDTMWQWPKLDTPFTWGNLIEEMKGVCERSKSTAV